MSHLEPVEKVGERNQHKQRISYSRRWEEAGCIGDEYGGDGASIKIDLYEGGKQRDCAPHEQPEGIKCSCIGE